VLEQPIVFELKLKSGLVYVKGDPYARSNKNSGTSGLCSKKRRSVFSWTDQEFINQRDSNQTPRISQ
jgi:hypothetical protein